MLALALSLFGAADVARAQATPSPTPRCFAARDWTGWRGSADAKTVYIRTGVRRIYRVDLAAPCHGVEWGLSHLVVRQRGSSWICAPLDLDLSVSDGHGFVNRCFVRAITPLSPAEAAALPANLRP
jgi:hypothetical protein